MGKGQNRERGNKIKKKPSLTVKERKAKKKEKRGKTR